MIGPHLLVGPKYWPTGTMGRFDRFASKNGEEWPSACWLLHHGTAIEQDQPLCCRRPADVAISFRDQPEWYLLASRKQGRPRKVLANNVRRRAERCL